jgi:hypothetical protein
MDLHRTRACGRGRPAQARALRVPCEIHAAAHRAPRGESLEAVARQARYGALAARLAPGELLLTAHHQEDQLETVLLALLRGSGVRGLAAMSANAAIAHAAAAPAAARVACQLERYARARALQWTEDPRPIWMSASIATTCVARCCRDCARAGPRPRRPSSRSAAHLAEAQGLLERAGPLASAQAADGPALRISVLRGMSLPERRNVLRCWIAARGLSAARSPAAARDCRPDARGQGRCAAAVQWRGGELRRHGDQLLALAQRDRAAPALDRALGLARTALAAARQRLALAVVADRHGDVDLARCRVRCAWIFDAAASGCARRMAARGAQGSAAVSRASRRGSARGALAARPRTHRRGRRSVGRCRLPRPCGARRRRAAGFAGGAARSSSAVGGTCAWRLRPLAAICYPAGPSSLTPS